ncbi:MAG: DUF1269 domain-containing protein [Gammaproteobacteria bacterium]|nr:MAG: DUF1269 domain-containing protein [Gammaproteobacteria bacterium]
MPEKNICILLYTIYEDVWQAVKKLQAQNFNLTAVSVVGNANDKEEQVVGVYTNDGNKHFQGTQAAFWEDLWKILDGELFFVIPELGALSAAGSIVPLLVKDKDDIDIHGRFSALAAALFSMGIPANSIRQYEAEIKAGKILLIVNDKRSEVERSCEILHSERQQATVHLA